MRVFDKSLRSFLISLICVFSVLSTHHSYAQVFTFGSTCQPAAGDSVVADAFAKQCVASWDKAQGNPDFFTSKGTNAALLAHQEGIRLRQSFEHCVVYNIRLQVKTHQTSTAHLELVFRNAESTFKITRSLSESSAAGWVQLYSHGIRLPKDFETLDLVFKSENNTLLIDELEITTVCVPSLKIGKATGTISSAEEVAFKPMTINALDTLNVLAGKSIVLSDEIVLKEGSEVRLVIAPCVTKNEACKDIPFPEPKEFAIYNFLSPNGDGQNDTFYIENLDDFPNAELRIFSKSGKMVFHSPTYKNDWDGGNESKGIYTYHLKLKEGDKPLTGELLLER